MGDQDLAYLDEAAETPFPVWRQVFEQLMAAKARLDELRSLPTNHPDLIAAALEYGRAERAYQRLEPEFTIEDDA